MRAPVGSAKLRRGYELVFTVDEYYDGPRTGVANFRGEPHFYDCIVDEKRSDYSNLFQLTPIDQKTFELALAAWRIWRKWEIAYHEKKVTWESHPALQADTAKYRKLTKRLEGLLKTDPKRSITRIGHFAPVANAKLPKGVLHYFQVKWSRPVVVR